MVEKRRPAKSRAGHDALADIDHITIRLDNGKVAKFDVAAELYIPPRNKLAALIRAARKAEATAAFWSYQAARAKRVMRDAERVYLKAEATADIMQRAAFKGVGDYTERLIRSMVLLTNDPAAPVEDTYKVYMRAEEHYEIVNSIARAAHNRSFTIQRLLGIHEDQA